MISIAETKFSRRDKENNTENYANFIIFHKRYELMIEMQYERMLNVKY